jgi:hypothetical protein
VIDDRRDGATRPWIAAVVGRAGGDGDRLTFPGRRGELRRDGAGSLPHDRRMRGRGAPSAPPVPPVG